MISLFTSAIITTCAIYIACNALKKYVGHNKNYEFILYWGLSFVLIAIAYAAYSLESLVTGQSDNVRVAVSHGIHIVTTFAWFLQLYAVTYVTKFCPRYDTPQCRSCKVCKRKLIRISIEMSKSVVITAAIVLFSLFPITYSGEAFRVIGNMPLDVFYEAVQGLMSIIICVLLLPYRAFKINLYVGFAVVAVAKALQIINIIVSKYSITELIQIEWAMMTAGMVLILLEVMKLINHTEQQEG